MDMNSSALQEKRERVSKRLNAYYEAEKAVLNNQSYAIDNMTVTRANLSTIKRTITELENQLQSLLENGGKRAVRRVIPRDF